jgi:hypothetical protein
MCLLAHSSVQCILCFAFLRLVYPMLPLSLDYPFCIASSVISNVYVCNNEGKNDFLYDKLNKSYTYMTEISLTQIQMHICELAVVLLFLKKWNLQANTYNVIKAWFLLQTTSGSDEPNIVFYAEIVTGNTTRNSECNET